MLAYASTDTKSHATHPNNNLNLQNAIVSSALLATSNDTDVSTGTNTKIHIIPLNNHLSMLNAVVSLMAMSACDRKHDIALYVSKIKVCLKCYIYHETTMSVYMPHMNSMQSQM